MVKLTIAIVVLLLLTSCAPGSGQGTSQVVDGELLDGAAVPVWLWSGADHPEWATCRVEPPSALCTEVGR